MQKNLYWFIPAKIYETCEGSYLHFELSEQKRSEDDKGFYNHCSLAFINILDNNKKLVDSKPFEYFLSNLL